MFDQEIENNINLAVFNPDIEYDALLTQLSLSQTVLDNRQTCKMHLDLLLDNVQIEENISTLRSIWPTNNTTLSRARKKLFPEYRKFRKNSAKYIDVLKIELHKLLNEIEEIQQNIDTIKVQLNQFTVDDGSFELNINSTQTTIIKLPSENRCCIDIASITPMQWYAWPEDIEFMSGKTFKEKDCGIGAGEYWLSFIFGGEVQGQSTTFDLAIYNKLLRQHERWEVKEVDPKTWIVRLGSHGTDAASDMTTEICDVLVQLKHFLDAYDALNIQNVQEFESGWLYRYIESLRTYLDAFFVKIVTKGDISNSDLRALMSPCVGAARAFSLINERCHHQESQIDFCGRKLKLTFEQYSKFLLIVPDILTFDEKLIAIASTLKHPLLIGQQTYSQFLRNWIQKIQPTSAFGNVNGVFLVHKRGFIMIPLKNVNDIFDYYRMGQGRRPNFKVKNIESPQQVLLKPLSFFNHAYFNETLEIFDPPIQLSGSFTAIGGCVTMTDDELFNKQTWNSYTPKNYFDTNTKILPPICQK